MASIVQYEHSVGETVEFAGTPVQIDTSFPGRTVHPIGGAVIVEHDPDKKFRTFKLTALMTGEDYYDFHALVYATTAYGGTYPRLVHVKLEGDTTHDWANVLVMPGPVSAVVYSNKRVLVTFTVYERSA